MSTVTVQRLERAITLTAYAMIRHDLPQLLPSLRRMESARDDLARNGDAIDYAKRVLDRGAVAVESRCRMIPNPPLADAA